METNTNPKGQINRGSKLGEIIYNLSKQSDVLNIVEIGTWLGLGSTKCILDGILSKKEKTNVYSLECNKLRHEEAKINLGFIPETFKLIHGTIIEYKELLPLKGTLNNETLETWLNDDLISLKTCPNVFDKLPNNIDLLIIDGGEFTGQQEFDKLWQRCKYIILDDTNAIKHEKTKSFILSKPDIFSIIENNTLDRNGFLVCEVKHENNK